MYFVNLLETLLTFMTVGALFVGGALSALLLLGRTAHSDRLALTIATIIGATAQAVAIGLTLGAFGALRFEYGLVLQFTLIVVMLAIYRKRSGDAAAPTCWRQIWSRLREHPWLCLCVLHALGSELIRGLLRPPLSWDSLMYHLLLAGEWLQTGSITGIFAPYPNSFNGMSPANGSVWLWWWMAPSHSDLFVNLAYAPHCVLLGLAVGGLARELGAKRSWPVAALITVALPTVIRWMTTQYVDILLASMLCAAAFFLVRWITRPRLCEVLLGSACLGIAVGTKLIGLLFVAMVAVPALAMARQQWKRRAGHATAAMATMFGLGAFFYLRNASVGLGPFFPFTHPLLPGPACNSLTDHPLFSQMAAEGISLWDTALQSITSGKITDALLGTTWTGAQDLGVGPIVIVLLPAILLLPLMSNPKVRRHALALSLAALGQAAFWVVVPLAWGGYLFTNVRFLIMAIGFSVAAAIAIGEHRGVKARTMRLLGIVAIIQSLLLLHSEMPREARYAIAAGDAILVALVLSSALRRILATKRRWLIGASSIAVLLMAPLWVSFRENDRYRAFGNEFTAHVTPFPLWTPAFAWLEKNGGDGSVAVVGRPQTFFIYPAMGMRLQRRALYINTTISNQRNVAKFLNCNPRHRTTPDASPVAWFRNLRKENIRWLLLQRESKSLFPTEDAWALAIPKFKLRFQDQHNRIYELLPQPTRRSARSR